MVGFNNMKQDNDELAVEDVAVSPELQLKDYDPQLKHDGSSMVKSPNAHAAGGGNVHQNSTFIYADSVGSKGLSSCVTSLDESKPTCPSSCSMIDVGLVMKELATKNYTSPSLATISRLTSREGMHFRQNQWNHLYHLESGSRGKNLVGNCRLEKDKMSIKEDLKTLPCDSQDMKPLLSKQIDEGPKEISVQLNNSGNNIISSKTAPFNGTQSKILSISGFSPFFAKRTKGKGIECQSPEACSGFGNEIVAQNSKTLAHRVAFGALLDSSTSHDQSSPHSFDKVDPNFFYDGINLRNWLKPGCRNIDKAKSLYLFKQIVELVDFAHSHELALQDLCPSCFILLPENRIEYIGSLVRRESEIYWNMAKKRPLAKDMDSCGCMGVKQQKFSGNMNSLRHQSEHASEHHLRSETSHDIGINFSNPQDIGSVGHYVSNNLHYNTHIPIHQPSAFVNDQVEMKWYTSPEMLNKKGCMFSSNIYGLGILLFELLCCFESWEEHSAVMLELNRRILPPNFLSGYPMEAGFCLWLLHPEPSCRPTTREILQSELLYGSQEMHLGDNLSFPAEDDDAESERLLDFLISLKENREKCASRLVGNIRCLEEDIKEVERRHLLRSFSVCCWTHKDFPVARERDPHLEGHKGLNVLSRSLSSSNMKEAWLMKNISQIENAYFAMRSQLQITESAAITRSDKNLLKSRETWLQVQNESEELSVNQIPTDHLGGFFEGLCMFARYSKLEVCGTLRNGDLLSSTNVICSLSLSRDEDYIAAASVSKKIKIFEFRALLNDSVDIHYPVIEMSNKSKLSCVCWNNYIKNYLVSTDYDGVVQIWDAGTGQGYSQHKEHEKRAWSVDFSQIDPTKFASGSDDCSVKLWSINEKNSIGTIWSPANVCCVQFSAYSSHLLVFGSADYKIYGYDLRHTRIPWCTLSGHGKAVSYTKFLDPETLVSASTDNSLKLWDLNKTNSAGMSSNACSLTFRGHTNEKVFTYHRSLPMPITSFKFGSIDPTPRRNINDYNGQFVSSVCWRGKSNMVLAANSTGNIKLLQLV
ncbi:protein SUPPRESSOR OF PHYA-105 1-like isoform X2 [Malania oleifera]|uniref:protein SUPPRESSOR OF PHYA-105 1-like isoform X2 n=1 Tax=Malania oleifera TaxID=397392 RepID=UPI0025ADA6E7|nr:protein SUPPRESSOR OF PHYA-105 1-like isoform X2 [Malania oleifera]